MPYRRAAIRFTSRVEPLVDPDAILAELHDVARLAGVNVLGAWRIPTWARRGDRRAYTVHAHPSVPAAFYSEFWELYAKHGRSFLAQMAWQNRGAFTMTEALRAMKPTGQDRWIQQLIYRYGIRDVFYVPNGEAMVVYWSPKPLLRLDASTRAALTLAAGAAAARLVRLPARRDRVEPDPGLSARQRAVLRLLSQGYAPQEIAAHLEITHSTVKAHIGRAEKKLGAKSAAHAVAEAIRRYVVIGFLTTAILATAAGLADVHSPDAWTTRIKDRHFIVGGSYGI